MPERDENSPEAKLDLDWEGFDFDQIFRGRAGTRRPETTSPAPRDGQDKYKLLLEISKSLSATLVLDELLVEILDTVLAVTRMASGMLMLRDEDGRFRVRVARDAHGKDLAEEDFEVSRSVVREVARTGRPTHIADIEKQLRSDPSGGSGRTIISFPLKSVRSAGSDRLWGETGAKKKSGAQSQTIGLIYVESALEAPEFSAVDLEFIEALAVQASVALENARLYERVNRDRLVLADENRDLKREVRGKYAFDNLIGSGERMRAVYDLISRVSSSNVNVMIRGESGTGKELVAKTVHYNSDRARKPFVSVNCAALPETLLESELFGIEKGVATGVDKRIGKFELASGGTFFLDEVGDMSLAIQAKLLRVIESREVQRLGGKVAIPIDVRLLAATHRDLEAAIRSGEFREDLYFRLNVVPLYLPALRERPEDVPDLIEHFLQKHAVSQGKAIEGVTRAALDALIAYDYAGNVRELENIIQRAILMCDRAIIDVEDLPREIFERREVIVETAMSEAWTADRLVREYASKMLARNKGNLTKTARDLGMDFKTLKKKIDRGAS